MTEILHDEARNQFRRTVEGHPCVLDYQLDGNVMAILHTGVPDAVGGRGIAAELTRVALETARAQAGACGPCAPTRRSISGATRNTPTCWPEPASTVPRRPQARSRASTQASTLNRDSVSKPAALPTAPAIRACPMRPAAAAGTKALFLQAPDAEALMRPRYAAYAQDRLGSFPADLGIPARGPPAWNPTRPASSGWACASYSMRQDADHATVEFVARCRQDRPRHRPASSAAASCARNGAIAVRGRRILGIAPQRFFL